MPIDRSQYLIEIKTSAETAGMDKTLASAQQAGETFQLLRDSAVDALGSIGELIQLLENPYSLAVAGATLATKMLVRELQTARQHASSQIKTSADLRDGGAGSGEPFRQTPTGHDSAEKNEPSHSVGAPDFHAKDETQTRAGENGLKTERLQRHSETPRQPQSNTLSGDDAAVSAKATGLEARAPVARSRQRFSDMDTSARGGQGAHASPEEMARLIDLNELLLGLEEHHAAEHGHLLDKIDSMINRVQALESAQRNSRWQSQ